MSISLGNEDSDLFSLPEVGIGLAEPIQIPIVAEMSDFDIADDKGDESDDDEFDEDDFDDGTADFSGEADDEDEPEAESAEEEEE